MNEELLDLYLTLADHSDEYEDCSKDARYYYICQEQADILNKLGIVNDPNFFKEDDLIDPDEILHWINENIEW